MNDNSTLSVMIMSFACTLNKLLEASHDILNTFQNLTKNTLRGSNKMIAFEIIQFVLTITIS